MAKIAFILLCHRDPDAVVRQAQRLTAAGDYVAIHFDARAGKGAFERIRAGLAGNGSVVFARREKCGWGEWSLVQATLNAVTAAEAEFPDATHFYMVSGDCMPIKSAAYLHGFLDENDKDFIEAFDYYTSGWIKTGLQEERLIYRHYFNERKHKALFYTSMEWQKRLGLTRQPPRDLKMMIGSQWWCLRRETIEKMLRFIGKRRDVTRFFRTTWIPDETFFQTLVRRLIPYGEIESRTLTFLMFSDYGMPVTFYNDHYDFLLSQDQMFARKISPDAHDLKARLGDLYASGQRRFDISGRGRELYQYLRVQGRNGRRFAPRFWEQESTLGRDRELLVVVSKKWHVARNLVQAIRDNTALRTVGYVFDDFDAGLPHLGGIENRMEKRNRHRRATMRLLFDHYGTDRLVICVDPSRIDLLRDFHSDRCQTRVLEIECNLGEDYLLGHAKRAGLASEGMPRATLARLLPAIRREFEAESEALRDAGFPGYYLFRENGDTTRNILALARFLGVPQATASRIIESTNLFAE